MFESVALTSLGVNVHQVGLEIILGCVRAVLLLPVMWRLLTGTWPLHRREPAHFLRGFIRS